MLRCHVPVKTGCVTHVREFRYAGRNPNDGTRQVMFAERILAGYARCVLRRVISAVALLALGSAPVVGQTRLLCRYTGVEITDCAEQDVPAYSLVRDEDCCERRMTRPLAATTCAERHDSVSPRICAIPAPIVADAPAIAFALSANSLPVAAVGPPVFLITRALLI